MEKEIRTISLEAVEVRAISERGRRFAEGYACVWNTLSQPLGSMKVGSFREKVRPGAFSESLKKKEIRAYIDHDESKYLGRQKNGTLEVWEDDKGLRFKVEIPNTQAGHDLIEMVNRHDISGCSFGMANIQDSWSYQTIDGEKTPVREIRSADIFDVSFCVNPAYSATENTVALRSLKDFEEQELIAARIKAHKEKLIKPA